MPVSYLTREGYQKLQAELDYLRSTKRQEVANRLHEAMEGGELIEDAEYEAAKNEQAFVEGRILTLEKLIQDAIIIDEKEAHQASTVQIGSTVSLSEGRGKRQQQFTIVGSAEADPKQGRISNESPVGRALLGKRVGDEVHGQGPEAALRVTITKIS